MISVNHITAALFHYYIYHPDICQGTVLLSQYPPAIFCYRLNLPTLVNLSGSFGNFPDVLIIASSGQTVMHFPQRSQSKSSII